MHTGPDVASTSQSYHRLLSSQADRLFLLLGTVMAAASLTIAVWNQSWLPLLAISLPSWLLMAVQVRLNPGKGDGSEQILRRFPKVATPPGIYIQQPGQPLRPIKVVVDFDQIWMPGKTWLRGFYMPLSAAGFEAVVHTTLSLQDPALDNAPLD